MQINSPGIIGNNIITIGGSGPGIQIYRPRQNGITIPFHTTQAATDVKIGVTGTPDILWTWADGTTSTTADPGAHDMSGTDGNCSLYVSDPLAIVSFLCNNNSFNFNLSFIKHCKKLEYLNFNYTNASGNISYLSGMTDLQYLEFLDTNVSGDIFYLSGMTKLVMLFFNSANISGDISALSGMTDLENLKVLNTNISGNISALSDMTKMEYLRIYNTNCNGNVSNFNNMTKIKELLIFNTDCYGNISNLNNMTDLTKLFLYDTNISETDMSNMVSQMYLIRTILGGNSCDIRIQDCNSITADAIAMIEGTGAYAGDGLKDAGCTVVY